MYPPQVLEQERHQLRLRLEEVEEEQEQRLADLQVSSSPPPPLAYPPPPPSFQSPPFHLTNRVMCWPSVPLWRGRRCSVATRYSKTSPHLSLLLTPPPHHPLLTSPPPTPGAADEPAGLRPDPAEHQAGPTPPGGGGEGEGPPHTGALPLLLLLLSSSSPPLHARQVQQVGHAGDLLPTTCYLVNWLTGYLTPQTWTLST